MQDPRVNHSVLAGEERLAHKYARFVLRHRVAIAISIVVLTLLAATQIPKLDIRNDPDTLLPPSNRYVATNLYAEHKFGMGNLMVIGLKVRDGDIYQPWFINTVQRIHRQLEALPNARRENFMSLAAQKIKYMGADENGLVFKRLIPTGGISTTDRTLAQEQLAFLQEGLEENPVTAPMLLYMEDAEGHRCEYKPEGWPAGCSARGTFIIADYDDGVKEIYLSWIRQVRDIVDEYKADDRFEILVAGEPYFLAYMLLDLVRKWWLFAVSLIVVAAILWVEFRHWRGALFPLFGVGATIVWTLGLMGFTQFKLTTMMVLTPMLLLAIGIGHSVQITRRFMQEQFRQGDCERAALTAIERTIVPATLSIITDVVGFATLGTVDISFYKAYAYFGMFGMFTLLITTTTLIPLLLTLFPCAQIDAEQLERRGWEQRIGSGMAALLAGPGKWVPIAGVALLLGASAYFTKIDQGTWTDPMPGVEKGINYSRAAFKEYSSTIQDLERLNQLMPGVISVSIPIRGKAPLKPECDMDGLPEGCWDPEEMGAQGIFNDAEVLGDIEKLENWMRAHPYIGFTGSYTQYLRLVNMLLAAEPGEPLDPAQLTVPTRAFLTRIDPEDDRDPNEIVQLYNGLLEVMTSAGDMDAFVSLPDWNEGVVMGFINTMDPVRTHQVTMDIERYIEAHKHDPGFHKVNFGLRSADATGDTNELSQEGPSYVRPGVGGFLGATEATREVAFANWLKGPLMTAVAIFVIAAVLFQSLAISATLIVILLITTFAQYGLGGYFTSVQNWSGNLAFHTQVSLSIAMGLGVDYGIYIISRLREEMSATGGRWQEALENTLSTTGSAVIVSVVVLLGSFIPLMNTELANTWVVATYISEALLIDVFTALLLLPLLIKWLRPRFVFTSR